MWKSQIRRAYLLSIFPQAVQVKERSAVSFETVQRPGEGAGTTGFGPGSPVHKL